jgi:hypothetical protein
VFSASSAVRKYNHRTVAGSEISLPLLRYVLLSFSRRIFKRKRFYGTFLNVLCFSFCSEGAMLLSLKRNHIINNMPNWIRFLTSDLLRKCAAILGFAGIFGFESCLGIHVCMDGHLCHGEDGNSGFYFDAVWFVIVLLSMACSIKSNLWMKPLFFCGYAALLTWWIEKIFRGGQINDDYFSMSFILVVIILCIRGLKWPSKKKNESHQNRNIINIFIQIIAYIIIACLLFGFVLATKHGIEDPIRRNW